MAVDKSFWRGTGSSPASLRVFHTVDAATACPSPTSSPWIRWQPHHGLPLAIYITNRWITTAAGGRPGRRR